MRHAFMYHGSFEHNHASLAPGAKTFIGTDGQTRELPAWPASAVLRFGYMEQVGKNFCVVRACDAEADVVVKEPVIIQPGRHMGFGVRLGPEPTLVDDDSVVLTLLEDLVRANPESAEALLKMRDRLKRAS